MNYRGRKSRIFRNTSYKILPQTIEAMLKQNQSESKRLVASDESGTMQLTLSPAPTSLNRKCKVMANLNKVVIIGNLVRDPEKRVGSSGVPFGVFTLASNYRYTDKKGQRQEEAAFVPCLAFGAAVDWLLEKKKGAMTIVSGRLRTDSWDDNGTRMSRLILICESVQFVQKTMTNETPTMTVNGRNGNGNDNGTDDIPF